VTAVRPQHNGVRPEHNGSMCMREAATSDSYTLRVSLQPFGLVIIRLAISCAHKGGRGGGKGVTSRSRESSFVDSPLKFLCGTVHLTSTTPSIFSALDS